MNKIKIFITVIIGLLFALSIVYADINPKYKKNKSKKSESGLQRPTTGVFDVQKNTMSNLEFFTSNYGIFGFDVAGRTGGGFWPRNSQNQYIFGGGTWFGAQKKIRDPKTDTVKYDENGKPIFRRYVAVSYDPSTAGSWFVPGRVTDPIQSADYNQPTKYRTYFSTDFNTEGEPFDKADGENWPVWDNGDPIKDTLKFDRYFGRYIQDEKIRNTDNIPKGPAFISQEDIFATFKDTDLGRYTLSASEATARGYPIRIQIEHFIYSWNFGKYKDFVFLRYDFINRSRDTLMECWHAPMMDVDLALASSSGFGAQNDRVKFIDCGDTPNLNMATQWTDTDRNEANWGFGYLGFDYLESPSTIYYIDTLGNKVLPRIKGSTDMAKYGGKMFDRNGDIVWPQTLEFDNTNFVREDRRWYPVEEQLGLVTFNNWDIADDVNEDLDRYEFMARGGQQGDTGPGDKRYLMATGPYNMFPDDTARVVVAVLLAPPAVSKEATGECDDLALLRSLSEFAQTVYDNSFQAPTPPDVSKIVEWKNGNNTMMIKWNSDSEYSTDINEKGLDFMGYKIYRARRPELDTFNLVQLVPDSKAGYPKGRGPYGWKEVASYELPTPFLKSSLRGGEDQNDLGNPMIDSMMIVDFGYFTEEQGGGIDSMAFTVMRFPSSAYIYPIDTAANGNPGSYMYSRANDYTQPRSGDYIPILAGFNTSELTEPWGAYFNNLAEKDLTPKRVTNAFNKNKSWLVYDANSSAEIFDSVMIGTFKLNRSLAAYNPLYTENKTVKLSKSIYDKYLKEDNSSGVIFKKETVIRVRWDCRRDTNGDIIMGINGCLRDTAYDEFGELILDTLDVNGPHLDTAYNMDSYRFIEDFGWVIDVVIPRENAIGTAFKDVEHIKNINASLAELIRSRTGTTIFPDFVKNDPDVIPKYLEPYMAEITNNRTFVDIGDDDKNGIILYDENPAYSEKLINNIDYSYKVLAFDEGDYEQPTRKKTNNAVNGSPNFKKMHPSASRAGRKSELEILSSDNDLLGGLYNFNFFSVDSERLGQYFGGDEFELEFQPVWNLSSFVPAGSVDPQADRINFALLGQQMTIRNITQNNEIVYDMQTNFEPIACLGSSLTPSENGQSFVRDDKPLIDTIQYDPVVLKIDSFGVSTQYEERIRSGKFTTGNFDQIGYCYSYGWSEKAYGTMGFEFDYTFKQFAGIYRPYSMDVIEGDANINMQVLTNEGEDIDLIEAAQIVDFDDSFKTFDRNGNNFDLVTAYRPLVESFNNGPGEYLLEFGEMKTEVFKFYYVVPFIRDVQEAEVIEKTFNVPYLELKLKNVTSMNRPDISGDSVAMNFPDEFKHMNLKLAPERFTQFNSGALKAVNVPSPVSLPYYGRQASEFINNYNTFAFAFVGLQSAARLSSFSNYTKYTAVVIDSIDFMEEIGDRDIKDIAPKVLAKYYSGLQGQEVGRYYLTGNAVDGDETVEFINVVNIGGTRFIFDRVNAGGSDRVETNINPWNWGKDPDIIGTEYINTTDFSSGDVAKLVSTGSAIGLPYKGAKIRFRVKDVDADDATYTDSEMDKISISPNPYYISHTAQRSPYSANKITFSRLPRVCTIEIFSNSGDLIRTIEHDENKFSMNGKEYWDLLSKNGLRINSQSMIAVITTPDGAQTVKPFSVVVGSYRVIQN